VFVKVLALVDLFAAVSIIASAFLPQKAIIYAATYLIGKGGWFAMMGNLMSVLDIACGIAIVFMAFGITHPTIMLGILVFLLQKVFFSFLSFG
jgi:hypothetical protein